MPPREGFPPLYRGGFYSLPKKPKLTYDIRTKSTDNHGRVMSLCCPICEAGSDKCLCGEGKVTSPDCIQSKLLASYLVRSDKYGFLHLNKYPSPEDSENGPMYTGLFWTVYREIAPLPHRENPFKKLMHIDGGYRTTPETQKPYDFSHDNMTGLVCYSEIYLEHWELYFVNRQFLHPKDIAFYLYAKRPHLFFWLLPITILAMLISCAQTYKTRNGQKIIKTDGKLLALMRCLAFNMNTTLKACTWLISKNSYFRDWETVATRYFRDKDHPCVMAIREWEARRQ